MFFEQSLGAQMFLNAAIDDSQTTFVVLNGTGNLWTPITTGRGSIGIIAVDDTLAQIILGEHVHITQRGDGAGGGNQDQFTMTREIFGTARAHVAGERIFGGFSPAHFYQMHAHARRVESMLALTVGHNIDGVVITDDGLQLKVTEGTLDMDVDIAPGHGFIDLQIFKLIASVTLTIDTAPGAGLTRIDNINADIDTMTMVYQKGTAGNPGIAPTPPTGQMVSAEINLDDTTVDITATEISDERTPLG